MSTPRDIAMLAKEVLWNRIGYPSWLRSIGIDQDASGSYFIAISVKEMNAEVVEYIPDTVEVGPSESRKVPVVVKVNAES
jgi:hypothetical protein